MFYSVEQLSNLIEKHSNNARNYSFSSLYKRSHVHRPDALSGRLTKGATNAAGTTPNIIAVSTATERSAFVAPVAVYVCLTGTRLPCARID